ncbi:hypothetical protein [Paenibacillus sp.]|uniref:hypothetical protein n=1 Tax=Paenibacillus sp. TaxID=58172 RepID=UPI002D53DC10|nr:hypothetical protein [Paenibacillus sp.]HZG87304.1 hypothetical protein [Paenibacillus sp.]
MAKPNFLQLARQLTAGVGEKMSAFLSREKALEQKIAALTEERGRISKAYSPDAGFNAAALQRIDDEIKAAETELAVLREAKADAPKHDAARAAAMIDDVRSEAIAELRKKAEEAEKLREEIAAAKAAYLEALRKHAALVRDADYIRTDYQSTIRELAHSVKKETERLRDEAQALDRQIYEMGQTVSGVNPQQHRIDAITADRDEIRRKIREMEAKTADIANPVRGIEAFLMSGAGNPYLIDRDTLAKASKGEM